MAQVQTRDEEGELKYFDSLKEAFQYADENHDVWKVSFDYDGERIRFVRLSSGGELVKSSWVFEPIDLTMAKEAADKEA